MAIYFYKLLCRGLIAVSGVLALIVAVIFWRKMYVAGKTFQELGSEGNVVLFMIGLIVVSLLIAWRIWVAEQALKKENS